MFLESIFIKTKINLFIFEIQRFPSDAGWAAKWEQKIKEFDPKFCRTPKSVVCSLHFVKSSMNSKDRNLVDHTVPMHFPPKISMNGNEPKTVNSIERSSKQQNTISFETCCVSGCSTKFDTGDNSVIGLK